MHALSGLCHRCPSRKYKICELFAESREHLFLRKSFMAELLGYSVQGEMKDGVERFLKAKSGSKEVRVFLLVPATIYPGNREWYIVVATTGYHTLSQSSRKDLHRGGCPPEISPF